MVILAQLTINVQLLLELPDKISFVRAQNYNWYDNPFYFNRQFMEDTLLERSECKQDKSKMHKETRKSRLDWCVRRTGRSMVM